MYLISFTKQISSRISHSLRIQSEKMSYFLIWQFRVLKLFQNQKRKCIFTDKVTCVFSLAVKPLKDVSLNTDCFWNWYSVEGVKVSNTPLISSELSWKQPKFSVFFRCMNIIDATEMRTEIVNAFQSFHISRNLLGRRILTGIRMSM